MAPGDAIRQANGTRIRACVDLERAASDALAGGLVLLFDVERDGVSVAAAARPQPDAGSVAAGPAPARGSAEATVATKPAEPERAPADEAIVAAAPTPPPPQVRRETRLPTGSEASVDARRAAGAAAAALASVNDAAQLSVPLVLYERRLGDAETTIGALAFGNGQVGVDVRAAVQEILDYHRTARDVRRSKLAILSQRGTDQRAGANALPYFSDSQVTEWMAMYPFLEVSLIERPRKTRMLPGEMAGRWDPDRAIDLLWEHARTAHGRLAEWARQ